MLSRWLVTASGRPVGIALGIVKPRLPIRRSEAAVTAFSFLVIAALAAWLAAGFAQHRALAEIESIGQQRLALYASSLRNAVRRHDYLPMVLARHPDIVALLGSPDDAALRDRVNRTLEAINLAAGSADLYVVDTNGITLAASNWNQAGSFVGNSYAFRPYFQDAIATGSGRFYGIGVTTGVAGYFLAHKTAHDGSGVGVVVAKLDLAPLEADWARAAEAVVLTDAHGVVFLASHREWKYRVFEPIAPAVRARINEVRQYGDAPLEPFARELPSPLPTARQFAVAGSGGESPMIGQRLPLPEFGWTLHYLSGPSSVRRSERAAALAALAVTTIVAFSMLAWQLRRRALRLERESHAVLEQSVAERTAELSTANVRLVEEIDERRRASLASKQKQDELVQAGKLAAVGQLSAAIAHEINQPLAALQTYVASVRVLIDRGKVDDARESFQRVGELTARIAAITQHLKIFARRSDDVSRNRVLLKDAVGGALRILEGRIRHERVAVHCDIADDAAVAGEAIRIEQVFLNLIGNALDAMTDHPRRDLQIRAERSGPSWTLRVRDSGAGIDPKVAAQLFTPFVTTKPAGKGLGLGLSLSRSIIAAFGGTLEAQSNADGGATFTVRLPAFNAGEAAVVVGARDV